MNPSKNGTIDPKELIKERYSFEDFIALIRLLRSPEGCPWDREQTHASIRKNFIEETYEALEAIDNEDLPLLREELGDVLLQIGLHVEMEAERGAMTFEDVITALCSKLVQRHPHVFGDVQGSDVRQVLDNWEAIKMRTKGQQTYTASLRSVPASFPALMRAQKLQNRAARAGFAWPDAMCAWDKLERECGQLKAAIQEEDKPALEQELGDALFALVGVARQLDIDAEEALTRAGQRFTDRFARMEEQALLQDKPLHTLSLEQQLALFEQQKRG